MIRAEYLRFLQSLNSDTTSEDMRKVANLVLANLNRLIPLGTHQGQRVRKMTALAQASWVTTSVNIQPLPEQADNKVLPITQLKSLTIGPFRGFAKPEAFDLASRLVLIYGPNGTGKSSFCEALEYGLLGNVAEAESKRFHNQHDYLKNAHTNTFELPVIVGTDSQAQEIPIYANEALYRFCFVEKNRIDSFSRIAAQSPAKQTELISTLFGLDSFNDFIRNFTAEIDGRYIDLIGVKAAELAQKRQVLAGSQHQLIFNQEELEKLVDEELQLAQQYREEITFAQMVTELNGNGEDLGAIKFLDTELQQPLANKSGLTIAVVQALEQSIYTNLTDLNAKQQELATANQKVSFKQLYEAVTQVQLSNPEHCPACKTPLNQVAVNPYANASAELEKLQHLAVLQQKVQRLNEKISPLLVELSQIVNTCCTYLPTENQLLGSKTLSSAQANVAWWGALLQPLSDDFTPWQHLEAQVKQLEQADIAIEQVVQKRSTIQQELYRFREFAKQITVLQTRRQTAQDTIKKAQGEIAQFDETNAELIAASEAEKAVVVRNQAIANAYAFFVNQLNAYKNALPAQLVADLGEKVVSLYNAFNRYDAQSEQLASVHLPLNQKQRLEISFQGKPDKNFDALHVLSEGHIRCLGLAILTAKNINESCPLLIFDDPVNAIDDEHRRAIREALFTDDFFTDKQIILAIHGEEFFNSTHQLIGKKAASEAESYVFCAMDGQSHVQVNSLKRPKNYVLAARELFNTGEYRDSLMSARRGLENICEKAWHHYGKHSDKSDDLISVSRRAPHQPWDLRALAENLKSKFNRSKADIPNKEQVVAAFTMLLGGSGKSTCWVYLNKGIHDEGDLTEFDQQTVSEIVTALEQLDATLG